jgi:methylenetetrahydrofolate--tRNA-(uracil-5-)-methyltransferase
MTGALAQYASAGGVGDFQPMNVNFGIAAPLGRKVKGGKKARGEAMGERALEIMRAFTGKTEDNGEHIDEADT